MLKSSSCCCQGDAKALCDSRMHDLQYCLSAARRVATTISQPRRLQSAVTLSSQRFLGRSLALFPSTLPYRAMYRRRRLGPSWSHGQNIWVCWFGFFLQYHLLTWVWLWCLSSKCGLCVMLNHKCNNDYMSKMTSHCANTVQMREDSEKRCDLRRQ